MSTATPQTGHALIGQLSRLRPTADDVGEHFDHGVTAAIVHDGTVTIYAFGKAVQSRPFTGAVDWGDGTPVAMPVEEAHAEAAAWRDEERYPFGVGRPYRRGD